MTYNHLVIKCSAFGLSTIDDHGLLEDCSDVILAGTGREASRLALHHSPLVCVELEELISALAHLPLWVPHEAASKDVDPAIVGDCCMALAALDHLCTRVGCPFPDDLVTVDFGEDDLLACVHVETSNQVHLVANSRQGGALARSWKPFCVEWHFNVDSEVLSLLHALNVGLKAANEFVDKLIPGDVLCRISMKLLIFFFVT